MTRTDAHRPSAINPDEYSYIASDYYGPWAGESFKSDRERFRAHMERTGGKFATRHNSGTCHICGAAALYVAKFHHEPSNTYIVTGDDCAGKLEIGDKRTFKRFRAAVTHERKLVKGKAVAREVLALLGLSNAWRVYEAHNEHSPKAETIVADIVGRLVKWGNVSEPQAKLIGKLLADIANRSARETERAAKAAKLEYVGTIGERRDFALTVEYTASFEGAFGVVHVHGMRDAAGNLIVYKGNKLAEKGASLRIKATVKAHTEYKGVKQTVVSRPKELA